MRKTVLFLLTLAFGAAVSGFAGDEERERQEVRPTYESPILSLLFLPANVLIKIASVFAPQNDERQAQPERSAPPGGSPR
ncbi:MAG: hypothetical protein ACREQQ_09115 [Candidatus Binatia bacterium]